MSDDDKSVNLVAREHAIGLHDTFKLSLCPECNPGEVISPPPAAAPPEPPADPPKHDYTATKVFDAEGNRLCVCGLARSAPAHHQGRPAMPMQSLGDAIQRIREQRAKGLLGEPDDVPLDEGPSDGKRECDVCKGRRWVSRGLGVLDVGFGQLDPCPACYGDVMQQDRLNKLLAQLPELFRDWTFDTWPTASVQHRVALAKARALLDDPTLPWAFFYGPTGRGKTGLGVAILREAIQRRRSAMFVRPYDLCTRIRNTWKSREAYAENEGSILAALYDVDVLLVDGLDEGFIQDRASGMVFQVVGGRHDRKRQTIITANRDPEALRKLIAGDPLVSRIGEMSKNYVLNFASLPDLRRGAA